MTPPLLLVVVPVLARLRLPPVICIRPRLLNPPEPVRVPNPESTPVLLSIDTPPTAPPKRDIVPLLVITPLAVIEDPIGTETAAPRGPVVSIVNPLAVSD